VAKTGGYQGGRELVPIAASHIINPKGTGSPALHRDLN